MPSLVQRLVLLAAFVSAAGALQACGRSELDPRYLDGDVLPDPDAGGAPGEPGVKNPSAGSSGTGGSFAGASPGNQPGGTHQPDPGPSGQPNPKPPDEPEPNPPGQSGECRTCTDTNCAEQIAACNNSPGCEEGFKCMGERCMGGDTAGCAFSCFKGNQNNMLVALEIFACAAAKCPAGCAGF